MVVELLATSVAGPTVLRVFLHVARTDVAKEVHRLAIGPERGELLFVKLLFSLFAHQDVSCDHFRADVGPLGRQHSTYGEHKRKNREDYRVEPVNGVF